jgi:hypothetical protein
MDALEVKRTRRAFANQECTRDERRSRVDAESCVWVCTVKSELRRMQLISWEKMGDGVGDIPARIRTDKSKPPRNESFPL